MVIKIKSDNEKKDIPRSINNDNAIEHIQESSDIAQTIKELNEDKVGIDLMSSIDMKSNLLDIEIGSILAVDSLVSMEMLPPEVSFLTRSKKRLAVSQNAKGRNDIVSIAQGMQQQKSGSSFLERVGNVFRPNGGN